MHNFITKIGEIVKRHALIPKGKKVIVALSGGADSVALLASLSQLGYSCIAAHCDFHLRGEESERDRCHAQNIANLLGAEYIETHFDIPSYKNEFGVSTEMACRTLRYDWFKSISSSYGDIPIAVAHHRDDNTETFFLNILRGTGIYGLTGMQIRNGNIIRPMLYISRAEIEQFLSDENLNYVIDSSNLINDVKRNRLRNIILPTIRQQFPDADTTIAHTITNLHANAELYKLGIDALLKEYVEEDIIDVARIATEKQNIADLLLFEAIRNRGFNHSQAKDIIASAFSSGQCFLSTTHIASISRGRLSITPIDDLPTKDATYDINLSTSTTQPINLNVSIVDTREITFDREGRSIYLDLSILDGKPQFTLRHWRKGDRIKPFGMKGSRLVSDIFNDAKLSHIDKCNTWLLTRNDTILWILGLKTSCHFPITRHSTQALKLSLD